MSPTSGPQPPSQGWFHSFEFPHEVVEGARTLERLRDEADIILHDVHGKRLLDIGAWDGFFSFEAERRGASYVLATDHYCWSGPGVGTRAGFDYAHYKLASKVDALDIDVVDLDPDKVGSFDVVLLLGVLYHVEDPYRVLKAAAGVCIGELVIETETALEEMTERAMRLYAPGELKGDSTNIWAPNTLALLEMLRQLGFSKTEIIPSPGALPLLRYRRSLKGRLRQLLTHAGILRPLPTSGQSRVIVRAWR